MVLHVFNEGHRCLDPEQQLFTDLEFPEVELDLRGFLMVS